MLNQTGIPSKDQVLSRFPKENDLFKPKAILECYEDIPCNPCSTSCPFDAIEIGENINKQPVLDVDKCTGCAICVTSCPGLAISVAQLVGEHAVFKIPYEFLPLPNPKDIWKGVNRAGEVICDATIEKVLTSKSMDRTALLTVSVPRNFLHEFITVRKP